MPDPKCSLPGCIHQPGFVINCGYDLPLALASVGEGWAELVREGFASVSPVGRIVQVKEKFGQLRIYTETNLGAPPAAVDQMRQRLQSLNARSALICEQCGAPGALGEIRGWWRTACPEHAVDARAARISTEAIS